MTLADYLPHGYCFQWNQGLLTLHVVSDALIALAYFTIPAALFVFTRRRPDVQFRGLVLLFAAFILGCGVTHVFGIVTVWRPFYWADGWAKAFTATVSVVTAVALWRLLPVAVGLPSPRQLLEANEALRRAQEELEARVAERTAELAELNATLEDRVARRTEALLASVAELESISYTISHDLRAPLRAIDGYSQMLLEDESDRLSEEGRRRLAEVRGNATRLARLIDGLLHFSRLGRMQPARQPVNLADLAYDVVAELQAADPRVRWELGSLPMVMGDRDLLHQVLQQLLGNAAKFSARVAHPCVGVDAAVEGDTVTVTVRDNGVGFDMRFVDKLFGVFQRLHHPADYDGVGMGLASVRRMLERMGGSARASGEPGQGATFQFTIEAA